MEQLQGLIHDAIMECKALKDNLQFTIKGDGKRKEWVERQDLISWT